MKEIMREIGRIYRCLESISNIEFKQFDLAKGQYSYLVRICEQPGVIQERVADMLKVDRTTASRAIQKLEDSGFVCKKRDAKNKKIFPLFPTEKGNYIYEVLKADEDYSNQTALQGITDDEQRILLDLLGRIRINLEPDWSFVKKGGQRDYLKNIK